MARRWNIAEEDLKRKELLVLYVKENRTISEISRILSLSESAVYDRLLRLNIQTLRHKKPGFNNVNLKVTVPDKYTGELAEFIGILLGDGHLSPTQVTVTLGTKENTYAEYVIRLMKNLFNVKPKIIFSKSGYAVIYLGSAPIVRWLLSMGLAFNKVAAQVSVPEWCLRKKTFMIGMMRGLIDTDGSIYKLKSGSIQISFCNRSRPLLESVRLILLRLGFNPSRVGEKNIYLTRKDDVYKYVTEIGFKNPKHKSRYLMFTNMGGSYSGNYSRL